MVRHDQRDAVDGAPCRAVRPGSSCTPSSASRGRAAEREDAPSASSASSWRWRYGRQAAISSGSGFRFCGGRHFTMLAMYTVVSRAARSPRESVEQLSRLPHERPAGLRLRWRPGPRRRSISRAAGLPSPGTVLRPRLRTARSSTSCGSARRPRRASSSVAESVAQQARRSGDAIVEPGPGNRRSAAPSSLGRRPRCARRSRPRRRLARVGAAPASRRRRGIGRDAAAAARPRSPRLLPARSAAPDTAARSAVSQGAPPPRRGSPRPLRASIAAAGSCGVPSRPRIATRLVSTSKPAPGSSASFTTIRSSSFRSSLARPLASASPGLEREADDDAAGLPRVARALEDVGGRLHRDRQRAVDPRALAVAGLAGPEVGRRRGHDQHVRRGQLRRAPPAPARAVRLDPAHRDADRRPAARPGRR